MTQSEYDDGCQYFTNQLEDLSEWKYLFYGAAYTTRLKGLSASLKVLVNELDKFIEKDN